MTFQEKIEALKTLMNEGRFHHATHRTGSGLWNGLWIYEKTGVDGGRFFEQYTPAFCFFDSDGRERQDTAYAIVRTTGVSVGAYGQG